MAYQIVAFDGIALSEYLQRTDTQNIGTGMALTSFQQISNGFFDNYGARRSPQGIRPITKSCVLMADTNSELLAQFDALRGKIGVRGKLTAEFEDGSLRWQWARLQNMNAPRAATVKGAWLPVELTWITAAQIWYRVIVSPDEWTWGDGTWTFGDGTAAFGESGTSATLTSTDGSEQTFTVSHSGNIDATNVAVTITAGTSGITSWTYVNITQGEYMAGDTALATGESVLVNAGSRATYIKSEAVDITVIYNNTGGYIYCSTSPTAHGLTTGDTVQLSGTASHDGIYRNITVTSSTAFRITSKKYSGSDGAGTVTKLANNYADFASFDSVWPTLAPGDNNIRISVVGNAAGDSTVSWEYYEHWA